jgi:integrase/recombinase XerD
MANASKFLDKRFKLADGTFKVRIRVTHQRKSIYINTPYSFDEKTYLSKIVKGLNMNNNEFVITAKKEIEKLEAKANNIIANLPNFSLDTFKIHFEQKGDRSDIIDLLYQESQLLKKRGNFSNANIYLSASNLFRRYAIEKFRKETFKVSMVIPSELKNFQSWAMSDTEGKKAYSLTTISIYLVRVQKIFNNLIKSGELNQSAYPFGRDLYQIPQSLNAKRPLTVDEVMQLYNYEPKTNNEEFARAMFLFSYLCSGMNMADIFNLRVSDVKDDRILFVRQKTKNKKPKILTVMLNEEIEAIIKKHKVYNLNSTYIFKVFNDRMTEEDKHKAKGSAILSINRSLKGIAKKIGLPLTISTYFARHSFATNLMESEAPIALISQKLGHASISTTQSYLSQFSKEVDEKYMSQLLKK